MADCQQKFLHLLQSLVRGKTLWNVDIDYAESRIIDLHVTIRARYLLDAMRDKTVGVDVRALAAYLLKRVITIEFQDFYYKLTPSNQVLFKNDLVSAMREETTTGVWKIMVEVHSHLNRQLQDEQEVAVAKPTQSQAKPHSEPKPGFSVANSPNVTIIRKYDPKNYQQLLFGFLTKHVGTSFLLTSSFENNQHIGHLTVYGEDEIRHFRHASKSVAKDVVVKNYITSLCVDKYMTWKFLPGAKFDTYQQKIECGLKAIGNFHPQIVVRELEKHLPALKCEITPTLSAPFYTCRVKIFVRGELFQEMVEAKTKQQAKVAAYMQLATKLYSKGAIGAYLR